MFSVPKRCSLERYKEGLLEMENVMWQAIKENVKILKL